MHDRRLDEKALTFGNEGALFMNAMTWWDHGTHSIWSQPWGTAITGQLEGRSLTLIPSDLVPWESWRDEHPDTKVLVDERGFVYGPQRIRDGFVIGVFLRSGIGTPVDDAVEIPDVLTFDVDDEGVVSDAETGSTWNAAKGIAVDGPLRGAAIQRVPYVSSFDWAWGDFFPHTEFWGSKDGEHTSTEIVPRIPYNPSYEDTDNGESLRGGG